MRSRAPGAIHDDRAPRCVEVTHRSRGSALARTALIMGEPRRVGDGLCVYREARRRVTVAWLIDGLANRLGALAHANDGDAARLLAEEALLSAGELESVLADRDVPVAAMAACADRLADIALGAPARPVPDLPHSDGPGPGEEAFVSPPEGFAYYGLQPGSLARLATDLPLAAGAAAVIGIRTIGATLSAIVAAALRRRGLTVSRTTVRPVGHPFDREVRLAPSQAAWVRAQREIGAVFLVVDEGPGLSGSSLLAAGEAALRAGASRVKLIGTRDVDAATLRARDAVRRFAVFGGLSSTPRPTSPEGAAIDVSGGAWRVLFCGGEQSWPAVWPQMERLKMLSADGRRLFKFEGLGRWGAAVRERATAIGAAGLGPPPAEASGGFVVYPVVPGRPLTRADVARLPIVARLADYCAFRAAAFPAPEADHTSLARMLAQDAHALLGETSEKSLPLERPIIPDARLQPHEWIATPEGTLLKTDGAAHGDDHLLPGPTDVAWDLAGAVVEWELDDAAQRALLDRYTKASGDRADARLPAFVRAYLVAELARTELAMGILEDTPEGVRLAREAARYRRMLARARR